MIKFTTFIVALLFSNLLHADEIRKWKDENGKTHYGDMQSAPVKSERVAITTSRNADVVADPQGKPTKPGSETVLSEKAESYGLPPERIQKCAALAKAVVILASSTKFDFSSFKRMKPMEDQIRLTCPSTGFECTLSKAHPEQDRCEPFAWFGGKDFIRSTMDGTRFKLEVH